jgi:eukaryotic translation initiation factor 2C
MLQLTCKVLELPKPFFRLNNRPTQNPNCISRWKVPKYANFFTTKPRPLTYRFVVQQGFRANNEEIYLNEITTQLSKCGIGPQYQKRLPKATLYQLDRASTHKILAQAKSDGAELVIFVLKNPSIPFYASLKDLADGTHELHTLCVVQKPLKMMNSTNMFGEYITNVTMKVNLKLGGVTQSVGSISQYLEQNKAMVLGGKLLRFPPTFTTCTNLSV